MRYYVYILSNKYCTVLYTGVTRDLIRRVYEHKNHLDKDSFTAKYNVTRFVYFEETTDVNAAIEREKQIKSWSRERKKFSDHGYESKVLGFISPAFELVVFLWCIPFHSLYREIATGFQPSQ